LNNVGLSYATDKNYPRALEALKQASRVSKIPSQRKQIEMNLAMVYGVSGDFDNARDVASKYIEGPALDNNLGLYAHLAKDDALAKSYLNMALTQSPTYYERAWENLDVVNDNTRGDDPDALPARPARATSGNTLPTLDALRAPEKKSRRKGRISAADAVPMPPSPPAAATVKEEPVAPAALLPEVVAKPTSSVWGITPEEAIRPSKPEEKSVQKPADKPVDKPSGLIVGPSEGN